MNEILNIVEAVHDQFREQERKLVVAESCTGGLISKSITDVPGSSDVFLEGMVCYSNRAKIRRLGVDPETLQEHGAVSEQTVKEMVEGALYVPEATDSIGVTGVAGPSGGTEETPVGTVFLAHRRHQKGTNAEKKQFQGDRDEVRRETVRYMLEDFLLQQ